MHSRFSSHLRSNVVGYVALFVAFNGSAYAVTAIDDDSVRSRHIVDGEVKAADIGTGQVGTADLANDKIQSADVRDDTLAGGGLGGSDIGPDAVGPSEIAPDAVGSSKVASDSLGADDLAATSVGTSEVAPDSLGASDLADSSVGTSEVAPEALTNADLAGSSVGASEVAPDSLGVSDLGVSSVGSSELGPDAVGASEVAPDSLGGSDINEAGLSVVDTQEGSVSLIRKGLDMGSAFDSSDPETFVDLGLWELRTSNTGGTSNNGVDVIQLCLLTDPVFSQSAVIYLSGSRTTRGFDGSPPICFNLDTNGTTSTSLIDWEILIPGSGIWVKAVSQSSLSGDTMVWAYVP